MANWLCLGDFNTIFLENIFWTRGRVWQSWSVIILSLGMTRSCSFLVTLSVAMTLRPVLPSMMAILLTIPPDSFKFWAKLKYLLAFLERGTNFTTSCRRSPPMVYIASINYYLKGRSSFGIKSACDRYTYKQPLQLAKFYSDFFAKDMQYWCSLSWCAKEVRLQRSGWLSWSYVLRMEKACWLSRLSRELRSGGSYFWWGESI